MVCDRRLELDPLRANTVNDNALIQLVITNLHAVLQNIGEDVDCQQKWQPTAQGTPTQDTLFLFKVGDRRFGSPKRTDVWTPSTTASFQGSIAGNVLTVESVQSGIVAVNGMLQGDGLQDNIVITSQLTGPSGGAGTYAINNSLTVAQQAMTTIAGEVHTEVQQYETTFQMSSLAVQDPSNANQRTAADLLNYAAYALQNQDFIAAIEEEGVGILRITDVRNPYFMDDRDRFEASPSFDFVLTHKQIIVSQTPIIEKIVVQILDV